MMNEKLNLFLKVVIILLRIGAFSFNCFMALISIGVSRRYDLPLSRSLPIFFYFFGMALLPLLIPIWKIYKSRIITIVLIITTSLPAFYLLSLLVNDIFNQEESYYSSLGFVFFFIIILFPFSMLPILLFLERWCYKRNMLKK